MGCADSLSGSASSTASGQLPSYYVHIRFASTRQIGRDCPKTRTLFWPRHLLGAHYLPRAHYLPESRCPPPPPPKRAPTPGLSPGMESPPSALFGHIEPPRLPSAAMSYTACAGIVTPWARSLTLRSKWPVISRRYFHRQLLPRSTWMHIRRPLPYRHSRIYFYPFME